MASTSYNLMSPSASQTFDSMTEALAYACGFIHAEQRNQEALTVTEVEGSFLGTRYVVSASNGADYFTINRPLPGIYVLEAIA